jgi:MurNAc alpha-1-phosphate uridylyltransferase
MTDQLKAIVLAAGSGQRMRPLTESMPKPLLAVQGKPLIQWLLESLHRAGCAEVVVNTHWQGQRLVDHFGEHPASAGLQGLRIHYSREDLDFGRALETAGGIARALPLLGEAFWVLAGDIHAPAFDFPAAAVRRFLAGSKLAHLWLVPNPPQHPQGDFGLSPEGLVLNRAETRFTYSTIGLYRARFFASLQAGNPEGQVVALTPMLRKAMDNGEVSGELLLGAWSDIGTPERLAQANAMTP